LKINLYFYQNKFWTLYSDKNISLWFKGYCNFSVQELIRSFSFLEKNRLENFISSITGHFALVFSSSKRTIILVDRIRSSPIYYFQKNDKIFISPTLNKIKNEFNSTFILDEQAKLEISMGGFTINKKSLYSGVHSPNAGNYILIENNSIKDFTYFNYFGKIETNLSKAQLIDELTAVTLRIFKETLERVGKRQIVIPLSAGNDSRLVASCLKHLGAENILCFTYGNYNSFEVITAKKIAKKLGFKWVFVPLAHRGERKFYKSQTFKDYLDFADSVDSIPYFQGLTSIKYLKENMLLEEDAVFINGNSGDFISGLHINKLYETIKNNPFRKNDLIKVLKEKYIEKHFSLWGDLKKEENISLLNNSIEKALEITGEMNSDNVHLAYEMLELIDRQSKYVIAGQKTFEFFNYEWLLPLWDDKYLHFWKKVPVIYKYNQTLFKEMLIQNNFGGVWDERIPINEKKINSILVRIVRLFFKTFFTFSSKNKWHQFETVFLKYWTDPILYYKFMPYWRIIFDFNKKPRNAVSWVVKMFFNKNL